MAGGRVWLAPTFLSPLLLGLQHVRTYVPSLPGTVPRDATTEPHPLKCPAPGECLPVQAALGASRHSNQRLGAGAVAAGLLSTPRLSASSGALPRLGSSCTSLSALLCVSPWLG